MGGLEADVGVAGASSSRAEGSGDGPVGEAGGPEAEGGLDVGRFVWVGLEVAVDEAVAVDGASGGPVIALPEEGKAVVLRA